jgi:hypothetical protein
MRLRSLPEWARKFAEEYVESPASWYLTKGGLISRRTLLRLQAQLRVINTFRGKVWRDCQEKCAKEMERRRLYKPHRKHESYGARVRMLKVCFESLGLAWTDDEDGTIALTSVGKSFLRAGRLDRLEEVAGRQLCKWQLVNPSLHTETYGDLRVFPYYATLAVLSGLPDRRVSADEFALFVMRMASEDKRTVRNVISRIKRFRGLPQTRVKALRKALASTPLHGSKARRPTSLLERVERVAGYLLPFLALGPYMELDRERGVVIGAGFSNRAAEAVERHLREETWIHFPTRKEWLGFYGDERSRPTFNAALDIYRDRSDTERAREALELAQAKGQAPEIGAEWLDAVAREEVLEAYLYAAPHALEPGLRIAKVGDHRGRQFPTREGPCDLLGVDRNDVYVVIELKKGRSASKVVGQLIGYVGALRGEYRWRRIRGFIVTTEVDRKLRNAFREEIREPGRRDWRLYGAEIKARFWQVEPASA